MELVSEQSRTRRTIRDLVALSALPAVWVDCKPLQVAEGLADALLGTLPLEFVYLQLSPRVCGDEQALVRTSFESNSADHVRTISHALAPVLDSPNLGSVQSIPNPIGGGTLRIVAAPVGLPLADGLVVAGSKQTDFPSEDERLLLDVGVNHAAMVLQRIMAEEAQRKSEQSLAADLADMSRLQEVSTKLVQAGDSSSLLLEIVDTAIAVTSADMGNIQLLDRDSGSLKIVADRGFESPFLEFFNAVNEGQGACGTAMQRGQRVVIEDVSKSPVFVGTPALDVILAAGVRAVQSTPLIARSGRLVGMLSTYYRVPRRPADRDLHVIDQLARQAADWIERTQAEEALRLSEGRIRQLLSLMPAAVYTCDAEGRIDFYNQRAVELWGREPAADDKFCGSLRMYRLDGSLLPHDQCPMAACVREGRSVRDMPVVTERPSGIRAVVSVNVQPLHDHQGRRVGAINAFEDITERERVLAELKQSERRLSEAQQVAHIGSWERDLRTDQVTWSDELYDIFGLKADEIDVSYQRFLQLIVPEDVDRIRALVEEAIRERGRFRCDYRITLADGSIRVLHERGGTILNEQGVPIRLVGTAQDITELREAEQAMRDYAGRLQTLSRRLLEVQEEERRHLARELHDEVGQMLTGLRLILKPTADLTTNAANAEVEKARALVDDLLETVRQLSFDLRPAALDQLGLLPGLLALFDRYTGQTDVRVNFKHQGLDGRLAPEVETTAYRIVQEALTNVARHAEVAEAAVRVWTTGDTLGLQVEDRGRGFDPEAVLGAPRSSGLAGMRERVELLSGRLTIESRPAGGTLITGELPLRRTNTHESFSKE
jgi:PAS domain S-box-containing protein